MEETILFRKTWDPENEFSLNRDEISHLKALRIYSEKKLVRVLNGNGLEWIYEVDANTNRGILKESKTHSKQNGISGIATAIPKGNRLEWLLQKGTELGLTHFYFLNFEQSDRKDFNLERAQKITEEAAAQSKRIFLPEVFAPVSLKDFLKTYQEEHDSYFLMDPKGESKLKPEYFRNSIWIIGPEGGFRTKETDLLKEKKVLSVRAGDSILRIETAGVFAASMFRYFTC
ncbi:16S rRNA (uracil(1498)-N(3))-methyltransferase [Leptospira sp. 201903070]|uniref:Ribosomal RNA small subunit methyltransferase E n=1 Tax=Leptospira ainlahdjerensis TaxID=2810033 RepID=A0ABS2UEI3_9LEPT|nr:16S rRNA (uracil(1498)-N(3))-methyltransferase [Leptospira ainlahdjerensis]MBM9578804.1 16S rRNA (uracil(1498)-N(3))-methyltransferase [Leptospira ainlahdjerensis]